MTDRLRVKVEDGKYEVVQEEGGKCYALRYGEEWQDLTGNKFVLGMAYELDDARKEVESLKQRLLAFEGETGPAT